jgi:hypothetical protein
MRKSVIAGAALTVALLVGGAGAADALKSGPQVGDHMPVFEPKCLAGTGAGKAFCPV